MLRRRLAAAYLEEPHLPGQRVRVNNQGIAFANGRSESITAWEDVSTIGNAKDMLVAVLGHTGLILPDRFWAAQGGAAGGAREAILAWYAEATGGRA